MPGPNPNTAIPGASPVVYPSDYIRELYEKCGSPDQKSYSATFTFATGVANVDIAAGTLQPGGVFWIWYFTWEFGIPQGGALPAAGLRMIRVTHQWSSARGNYTSSQVRGTLGTIYGEGLNMGAGGFVVPWMGSGTVIGPQIIAQINMLVGPANFPANTIVVVTMLGVEWPSNPAASIGPGTPDPRSVRQ